jgi:hypothetical protein
LARILRGLAVDAGSSPSLRKGRTAVTRPTIQAILEDGPRAGETVQLDVEHEGHPPKEFLLADEHLGARSAEESRRPPSGAVSTYRLSAHDEERGAFIYRVAPRE